MICHLNILKPSLAQWIYSNHKTLNLSQIGLCSEEIWDFEKPNSLLSLPFQVIRTVGSAQMQTG